MSIKFIRKAGRIIPIRSKDQGMFSKSGVKKAKRAVLAANAGIVATSFAEKDKRKRSAFHKPVGIFKDTVGAVIGTGIGAGLAKRLNNRDLDSLFKGRKFTGTKARNLRSVALVGAGTLIGGSIARLKGTIIKKSANFAADKTVHGR